MATPSHPRIILVQPQIPQNAGNIVRTCAVTGALLTLVRPFGFSTSSRHLKRAGLDYWEGVNVEEIDDLDSYLSKKTAPFFFFSSKASTPYTSAHFPPNAQLIFGSESTGLPSFCWEKWPSCFFQIPMLENARCLNLATSVGIVLYEVLRQNAFLHLKREKRNEKNTLNKQEELSGTNKVSPFL